MTSRWITGWVWTALVSALLAGSPARSEEGGKPGATDHAEDKPRPGAAALSCADLKEHQQAMWLLFQYMGLDPRGIEERGGKERPAETQPPVQTGSELVLMRALARRGIRVEYVVASVADPTAPGLGGFDQGLDALTLALEARNEFRLDRYGFPWQFTEDEGRGQMKLTIAPCAEGEPGVVLYRAGHIDTKVTEPPEPERLLLLFLVPERPTSGISQKAFRQALEQIRTLRERDRQREAIPPGAPVLDEKQNEDAPPGGRSPRLRFRVIGPAYSGAAVSLRKALRQALDDKDDKGVATWQDYQFDIISGSASYKPIKTLLEKDDPDHVRFRATVIPTVVLEKVMRTYLRDHLGARPEEIAFLIESTTSFGQGFMRRSGTDRDATEPLVLPFPMHISRLTSEWEQQEKERRKEEARDRSSSRSPTGALSRVLRSGDRPDLLPSAAPRETAVREDLALINLLNSIAVEKIHYIGLYATATDDKRFLAQQIHRFAPDVVLFTVGADLLYAHPDDRDSFSGMLVASTYPLFNENQQTCYPQHTERRQRLQFSDEAAQGVYNAMLAHLGKISELLEYTAPRTSPLDAGQELSAEQFMPAAWISVVGNLALVPLRFDHGYDDQGFVYRPRAAQVAPLADLRSAPVRFDSASGILSIAMLVVGLWCLLHCIAFFWSGDELPRTLRFLEVFHCAPMQSEAGRPWLYLLACFGALLAAYSGIFSLFVWHLGRPEPARWAGAIAAAVCWGLLWIVVLRLLVRPWMRVPHLGRWKWAVIPVWICAIVLGCKLGVDHLAAHRGFMAYLFLFSQRAEYPGYGVSLLLPFMLLCGVLYFWGLSQLDRMHLLHKARHLGVVKPHGKEVDLSEIEDSIRPYASGKLRLEYYLALSVLLVYVGSYFIIHVLTLDHWATNWLFRCLIFLAVASITFGFARFHAMWHHTRALLKQLANQPLAEAYRRVPEAFCRPLGLQIVEDLPQEVEIEALRSHLWLIRNHLGQVLSPPPPAAAPAPGAAPAGPGTEARPPDAGLEYLRQKMKGKLTELKTAADALPMDSETFEGSLCTCAAGMSTSREGHAEAKENPFYRFSEDVVEVLKIVWQGRPLKVENEPLIKEVAGAKSTYEAYLRYLPDAAHVLLRLMEDFIAIQGVIYVNHLFLHLRNLLTFVTASMLCLIGAVSLYPFQPHHLLMVLIGLIVVPVVAVFLLVFVQMNRNEVLSRIAGTRPGKVDLDRSFLIQVAIYACVPLLGLAAAQFPLVGAYILSWLEPVLRPLAK